VGRSHREIVACVAAFNEKAGAEVLAANAAFNEKLAMQALDLDARFEWKLDVELDVEKIIAIEKHLAELEVPHYEQESELCAERDKYKKMLTLERNKYNTFRDYYVNKIKKRHQQICVLVAPSFQSCAAYEEAYVEGHAAPPPSCGVNIVVDQSVPGVEGLCDGFILSSSTHFNEKYPEVNVAAFKK